MTSILVEYTESGDRIATPKRNIYKLALKDTVDYNTGKVLKIMGPQPYQEMIESGFLPFQEWYACEDYPQIVHRYELNPTWRFERRGDSFFLHSDEKNAMKAWVKKNPSDEF